MRCAVYGQLATDRAANLACTSLRSREIKSAHQRTNLVQFDATRATFLHFYRISMMLLGPLYCTARCTATSTRRVCEVNRATRLGLSLCFQRLADPSVCPGVADSNYTAGRHPSEPGGDQPGSDPRERLPADVSQPGRR